MSTTTDYQHPTPPKKRRHPLRWVLFGLVAVILILIIVVVSGGGGSSRPGTVDTPANHTVIDDPMSDGGWTLSAVQITDNQFGDMLTASIRNDLGNERSGFFNVTVYGPDNARLGLFNGATTDVAGGQTVTVSFIGENQAQLPPVEQLHFSLQSGL